MAINESEDLISEEGDTRSIIDEDDHMDVEVERRMSQLIVDIDGVGEEKTKKPKKSQRIVEEKDNFSLSPQQHLVNKDKIPLKKDSLKQQPSQGKVTIPIDWDYIIDKYIKNTNTNAGDDEVLPNSDDEFY